jgi:hypothetical protein
MGCGILYRMVAEQIGLCAMLSMRRTFLAGCRMPHVSWYCSTFVVAILVAVTFVIVAVIVAVIAET